MIRVYNTLSKSKEPFEPVTAGRVGIYLCGPTVYKPSHVGHMVGPVIFDCIKRYLAYCGYDVTLVVNITDDGIPFNAFSQEEPDTAADLEDRAIGGLGIHLVRKLMDEVHYQRGIGRNVVTLVKQLEGTPE